MLKLISLICQGKKKEKKKIDIHLIFIISFISVLCKKTLNYFNRFSCSLVKDNPLSLVLLLIKLDFREIQIMTITSRWQYMVVNSTLSTVGLHIILHVCYIFFFFYECLEVGA